LRIPIGNETAKIGEAVCNFAFGNHFAVHADSFAKGDEVRGGKETGAKVRGAADGIDHRADGAFAVGAGDVDDPLTFSRNVQLAQQALDIFEPELDPETLRSVEPGQRLTIVHCEFEK